MGRYADLKFVTEAEVPELPGGLVARESWVGRLVVAAVLLALGCGVPVFAGGAAFADGGWSFELSAWGLFDLVLASIGGLVVAVVSLVDRI